MYTLEERADMLECYLSSNKSPVLALRSYVTKFPLRRHPEKKFLIESTSVFGEIKVCCKKNKEAVMF